MASARIERIASRKRRDARRDVQRLSTLALACNHGPTWHHIRELHAGEVTAHRIATATCRTIARGPWYREGTR